MTREDCQTCWGDGELECAFCRGVGEVDVPSTGFSDPGGSLDCPSCTRERLEHDVSAGHLRCGECHPGAPRPTWVQDEREAFDEVCAG